MKDALRNKPLWLFITAYVAAVAVLLVNRGSIEETLAILVLFGIAFPLIALLSCIKTPLPTAPAPARPGEALVVVGLLIYTAAFLGIKGQVLGWLEPEGAGPRLHDTLNTLLKLAAFVAVPVAIYYARYRALPDTGQRTMSRARQWLTFAIVGTAMFAITLVISSGAKDLLGGRFTPAQSLLGLVLCFGWMTIEAGVVEEVFFRWLLQSRIAALTGSQLSAICLCALAFGLAHAPGMWLRGAGAGEGLGTDPALLTVVAYSIATQGIASITLAVLWARTRSLLLIIGLHALVDTASNTGEFIETWLQ